MIETKRESYSVCSLIVFKKRKKLCDEIFTYIDRTKDLAQFISMTDRSTSNMATTTMYNKRFYQTRVCVYGIKTGWYCAKSIFDTELSRIIKISTFSMSNVK